MFYFELATLQNCMHSNIIFLLDVFTGYKQEARAEVLEPRRNMLLMLHMKLEAAKNMLLPYILYLV
jgi:hypothetical protein